MKPERLFSDADRQRIVDAVRAAESTSAGEIRVKVIGSCLGDTRRRAVKEFFREGVHRTRDRSGVLILLVLGRRRIEVVADDGIAARVPQGTWNALVAGMGKRFGEGAFTDGLVSAVESIGALLAHHFPRRPDDVNELPDDLSIG